MVATIISDCRDSNAVGRQVSRVSSLFGCNTSFVGVATDLEASGNIIDMLDAIGEEEGVVLVNVAPRSGSAKKWPNGTPFGYLKFKNTLVVSSIDGLTLSLVKKFGLTDEVEVLDIPTVMSAGVADGRIEEEISQYVIKGQFRSFDFVPRAAHYLLTGIHVPSDTLSIAKIQEPPFATVWWVDNFGNCKTTILASEFNYSVGDVVSTKFGDFKYYSQLKDVPDGETALIAGSSGIDNSRFIELTVQGGSAGDKYKINSGNSIF